MYTCIYIYVGYIYTALGRGSGRGPGQDAGQLGGTRASRTRASTYGTETYCLDADPIWFIELDSDRWRAPDNTTIVLLRFCLLVGLRLTVWQKRMLNMNILICK